MTDDFERSAASTELLRLEALKRANARGKYGSAARRGLTRADKRGDRRYALIPLRTAVDLGKVGAIGWSTVILIHLINWTRFNKETMPTTALATGCPDASVRAKSLRKLQTLGIVKYLPGNKGCAATVTLDKRWERLS